MSKKVRSARELAELSDAPGLTGTSHIALHDLIDMSHNLTLELKKVMPSGQSLNLSAECSPTTIPEIANLRKTVQQLLIDMKSREESATDETVVYNGNPLEMGSGGIKYSEVEKLKNMEIVGVLLATPNSAIKEIGYKFDEKTIERNILLCGLCLLSMGYPPNELKYVKKWIVFDRNRIPLTEPGTGIHFVVNSKPNSDWCVLPIPREFVPTAYYLNDNPKVWEKISGSFDFNKLFEKYKSKIRGVPFIECEAIKQYLAEGGKFETIRKYIGWIIEVMGLGYKIGMEDAIKLYPKLTTFKMKNCLPDLYLMKWAVVMSFTKDIFEPNVVVDCPRHNPIQEMIKCMVDDIDKLPRDYTYYRK